MHLVLQTLEGSLGYMKPIKCEVTNIQHIKFRHSCMKKQATHGEELQTTHMKNHLKTAWTVSHEIRHPTLCFVDVRPKIRKHQINPTNKKRVSFLECSQMLVGALTACVSGLWFVGLASYCL